MTSSGVQGIRERSTRPFPHTVVSDWPSLELLREKEVETAEVTQSSLAQRGI